MIQLPQMNMLLATFERRPRRVLATCKQNSQWLRQGLLFGGSTSTKATLLSPNMWLCHFLQTQWAVQVLCLLSVFVSCGVWCGLFWAILPQTWGNTPNYGMCLTLGLRQIHRKPSFFICFPIFSNEISMFPVDFPIFSLEPSTVVFRKPRCFRLGKAHDTVAASFHEITAPEGPLGSLWRERYLPTTWQWKIPIWLWINTYKYHF